MLSLATIDDPKLLCGWTKLGSRPANPMIFALPTLLEFAVLAPVDEVGITSGRCTLSGDATGATVGACNFLVGLEGLFRGAAGGGTNGVVAREPGLVLGGALPDVILLDPKMEKSKSSGSMFESLFVLSKKALISFLLLNLLPVGPIIKTS